MEGGCASLWRPESEGHSMCITNFYESFHLLYNSICCRMLCYQFNGSLLRYQCNVCYTLHPRSKIQTCSSRGKLCGYYREDPLILEDNVCTLGFLSPQRSCNSAASGKHRIRRVRWEEPGYRPKPCRGLSIELVPVVAGKRKKR